MPTYTNPNKSWQEQNFTPTISATALQNPPTPLQVKPYVDPTTPDPLALIPQPDASNVNNLQTEQSYIMDALNSATTQMGNQGVRAQELATQYGVPESQKAYNETISQIRTLNSDAFNARMKSEDRLAPTFAITGEQAAIERQRSARSYGLAASAEALRGNIALAQQYVQTALDAEFKPLEARISFLRDVLETNKSNLQREDAKLSAAESRRFDMTLKKLDIREKEIARQREDKSAILNTAKLAGANLAPNDVIQKITEAQTPEEALALAGQYLQDPKAKMEIESIRLSQALTRLNMAKTRKEIDSIGQPTATERKEMLKELEIQKGSAVKAATALSVAQDIKTIYSSRYTGFLSGVPAMSGSGKNNFLATEQQLKNMLTLENLEKMRGTGAISNADMAVLSTAATKLDKSLSDGAYRAEVDKIISTLEASVKRNSGAYIDDKTSKVLDAMFPPGEQPTLPAANYF